MKRRTATTIGAIALGAVMLVSAWALLAPPELGGSTRYVILDGTSMEPSLQAGDLALVRGGDEVATGDVVLYEHPELGVRILHRVVRETRGRLVLRGDNNDFLDDVRPAVGDVEGELWFAIPRVGSVVAWAREPLHAALLVFALTFVALGGFAAFAGARRPSRGGRVASRAGTPLLGVALGAVAVFALLAAVSFTRPTTHAVEVPDAYAHVGTFSYGAQVDESDVYPDGTVDTGETAFLQLVPTLDLAFRYELDAPEASSVRGTTTLTAVLSDGAGWTRTLPLGEPSGFTGRTGEAAGTLDLDEVVRVVDEMKALTGSGTSVFGVTVEADTEVRGRVRGEQISPSFQPKLRLALDPVSLRPETSEADAAAFTVRRSEPVGSRVPATLALGGLRISVDRARTLALLGLAVALLAAAFAGASARRGRNGGAPSQIASLLGDRLVTLSRPPSTEVGRVTELGDVTSLAQIAEHYDRIVLHWRDGNGHAYQVDDGTRIYRLRLVTGVERIRPEVDDDADTLVLAPTELPPRAAAG